MQACLWLFFNYLNAYLCGVKFYKIPFSISVLNFFSLTMRKEYICNKKELSIKKNVYTKFRSIIFEGGKKFVSSKMNVIHQNTKQNQYYLCLVPENELLS